MTGVKEELTKPRTRDNMESGKIFNFRDPGTIFSFFPMVIRLGD